MELEPQRAVQFCSRDRDFGATRSTVVLQSDRVKVVRRSLSADESLKTHRAPGPLIVQCLEGRVDFSVEGSLWELNPGDLLHLPHRQPHGVHAHEPSTLLLTILVEE